MDNDDEVLSPASGDYMETVGQYDGSGSDLDSGSSVDSDADSDSSDTVGNSADDGGGAETPLEAAAAATVKTT